MEELFGGIEAGGSKFVCAIGKQSGEILTYEEFPTTTPDETFDKVIEFFKNQSISALGVGSFGPVDVDPDSHNYGQITGTPKEGWENTNIRRALSKALDLPVIVESDVGCAALGEYYFGPAKDYDNFLYLTVGTGIGGAVMTKGQLNREKKHPEMGHIFIPHDFMQDPFDGICPYHGDCFEGLASGPAIEARGSESAAEVIDPIRWDLEALYLARGIATLTLVVNPRLIILGGGVARHGGLIDETTSRIKRLINNYTELPSIVLASDRNAVLGAIRLASQATAANQ